MSLIERPPFDPTQFNFAPVIHHDGPWTVFDFTNGYNPQKVEETQWGIGRYDEKRTGMYNAPQFENRRNLHVGIDLWTPAGEPVHLFYDGVIAYVGDNAQQGDYGPTIVTRHDLKGLPLFALHGHLSRQSIAHLEPGQAFAAGDKIAEVGPEEENGGWVPHLHFQLSLEDPGGADMPGVVDPEKRRQALQKYPDPRLVLGSLY